MPATLPTSGPITRLHTPTPATASGTVTAKVTTGITACRSRWRKKSIRRKKIHVGACSANATGRYATASVSVARRSSP
jgi:hypothetical protein